MAKDFFYRVASGLAVQDGLDEVLRHPEFWDRYTARTDPDWSPHHEVSDIWLRMTVPGLDHRECAWVPGTQEAFQNCYLYVYEAAAYLNAERIGRVMISKLPPGGNISEHVDIGPDLTKYYDNEPYYKRFHIVLHGASVFRCADESVLMCKGDMWWFDNTKPHSVSNGHLGEDRIHLFFDLRISDWRRGPSV